MKYMLSSKERITAPSYDQGLLWAALLLLGFGLVMVYSASIAMAEADKRDRPSEHLFSGTACRLSRRQPHRRPRRFPDTDHSSGSSSLPTCS